MLGNAPLAIPLNRHPGHPVGAGNDAIDKIDKGGDGRGLRRRMDHLRLVKAFGPDLWPERREIGADRFPANRQDGPRAEQRSVVRV